MAKPTTFHRFLHVLQEHGTLLRVYTQNIDFLKLKVGLDMVGSGNSSKKCIALHGTLEHLRCKQCSSIFSLEANYALLNAGELPECSNCRARMLQRSQNGKRQTSGVSHIYPDVILYGQPHPEGEEIAQAQNKDLGIRASHEGQADFLLVVGTSLKIPGVTQFIRKLLRMLSSSHSKSMGSDPIRSVYLNDHIPNNSNWAKSFDRCIETDCQLFAQIALEAMEKERSKTDLEQCSKQRLDSRPTWRWWSE